MTSFINTAKKVGEATPPCLVPQLSEQTQRWPPPHLTQATTLAKQHSSMLTSTMGAPVH